MKAWLKEARNKLLLILIKTSESMGRLCLCCGLVDPSLALV